MLIPRRSFSAASGYRYGFNGKQNDNDVKGLGNSQDYGMRIYDPRLGRFLSVDPLTAKYPWYTPYQFAGNKPTQFVDLDGMEEADISKKYLPFAQDISNAPLSYKGLSGRVVQTTFNLHGYAVNNLYFWENNIKLHPEFLDDWNKGRVLVEGKAPIFTNQLKENFTKLGMSTEGLKIGDVMEHHHINQGRTAIPITSTEHDQIPTQKNNSKSTISSRFGRISKLAANAGAIAGPLAEGAGLFSGNPDSWINLFGKQNDVGVVYKQAESNLYYTIVKQESNGSKGTNHYWIYSSYEWDSETKKYVGKNPIGYGETYSEKTGYTRTVIYDLEGKVRNYQETGKRAKQYD